VLFCSAAPRASWKLKLQDGNVNTLDASVGAEVLRPRLRCFPDASFANLESGLPNVSNLCINLNTWQLSSCALPVAAEQCPALTKLELYGWFCLEELASCYAPLFPCLTYQTFDGILAK
jgi:hypothetical protein